MSVRSQLAGLPEAAPAVAAPSMIVLPRTSGEVHDACIRRPFNSPFQKPCKYDASRQIASMLPNLLTLVYAARTSRLHWPGCAWHWARGAAACGALQESIPPTICLSAAAWVPTVAPCLPSIACIIGRKRRG